MLFDGYDLVIYGSVLPHLMKEWQLTPQTAGLLGAASLMGMMLGAVTLGMAADKFGRKNIIIACTILSSLAVAMNGFAQFRNILPFISFGLSMNQCFIKLEWKTCG